MIPHELPRKQKLYNKPVRIYLNFGQHIRMKNYFVKIDKQGKKTPARGWMK